VSSGELPDVPRLQLACIAGARPNFMKVAPLLRALEAYPRIRTGLIHTGQHYDESLSKVFFDELEIRPPDVCLNVGSGTHGAQTACVMERLETVLQAGQPFGTPYDRVVVVGDVNSTMAAALVAAKLGIPIAHVEAGLRSFDRTMPEEINRVVTDTLSDLLFVSEPAGVANLMREGHPPDQIHLVGNVMIDTLRRLLPKARSRDTLRNCGVESGRYAVMTLHRPANVDRPETLARILEVCASTSRRLPIVFPVHPRTEKRIRDFGLSAKLNGVASFRLVPPLGYLDFLALTSQSRVVITDSGGLQEESTALGIPCLTMRPNTERPITVDMGTSTLVGDDVTGLERRLGEVIAGTYKKGQCPALWDGKAAERIAGILAGAA
jgi:UDP-N-acetylglucosamine 2-epimerase (non-hydrolysing)